MEQLADFLEVLGKAHSEKQNGPSVLEVDTFLQHALGILFPGLGTKIPVHENALAEAVIKNKDLLERCLLPGISDRDPGEISEKWSLALPVVYGKLLKDAAAIEEGDPAAQSLSEVITTYPGFLAIAAYRIAHVLLELGVRMVPRMITELAHSRTGIDIHPGAAIGERFFIDHGTGVVIGETTIIGNNVKVYQGVTLGALSVQKKLAKVKRHPTIQDNVVIYAGATILGGKTIIGESSVIGGNVWLTESVPAHSLVHHEPGIQIKTRKKHVTVD